MKVPRFRKREQQTIPQATPTEVVVGVTDKEEKPKVTWFQRNIKRPILVFLSSISPTTKVLLVLVAVWLWFLEQYILNSSLSYGSISVTQLFTTITLVLATYIVGIYYHNFFAGRVCSLILDDTVITISNSDIEHLEHSERCKVVNTRGTPVYVTDETKYIRFGRQAIVSIPQEALLEYGSPLNMMSLCLAGCSLVELMGMESTDYGIYYVPHSVSVEQLTKLNSKLKLVQELCVTTVTKLQRDLIEMTKNIRGPEKQVIDNLIEGTSQLKKSFMGDESILRIAREQQYTPWWQRNRYGYQGYNSYNRFGESGQPSWSKVGDNRQQSDETEEE